MEFDEVQHGAHGIVPEFGAIFMSNSATKRECFRLGLFGLPSSQGRFVMQVKEGMALFLFEYETRKLHGVFRACSDGAMNIEPNAFRSSGKQFPAQVRFTPIWSCIPLKEDEFRDTIKENYFSAHKFNFGLSQEQVHRLLRQFSRRKETDHQPQRQLNELKISRGYSMEKVNRVNDGGVAKSEKVKDENDSDDNHRPFFSTEYPGESFGYAGRESVDGKFVKSHRVENKHEVCNELGPGIMNEYNEDSLARVGRDGGRFAACDGSWTEHNSAIDHGRAMSHAHSGYFLSEVGQVPDHGRFGITNRLESEHNLDNGFVPPISTECRSLFQPNFHRSVDSNKPIFETDSAVQDQHWLNSTFSGSIEPQISHPSYGDGVVNSTLPYDPDVPSINFRRSSSFGIDHNTNPVLEYTSRYKTCAGNLIPTPKDQPYFPSVEPNSIKRWPDDSSGFGNHIPSSTPNHYELSSYRTSIPFSGAAAYSENLETEFSENQDHVGLSFSHSPIAPVHLSESGNNGMENKCPPSYSSNPSLHPSFAYNYSFSLESQGRSNCEIVQPEEKNEALTANVPLSNKGQVQLHGYFPSSSIHPPSVYNYGFPVQSKGKLEPEVVQQEEKSEAFAANVPLSNKGEVQLHGYDYSGEPRSVHVHENTSPNHDLKYYQDPKTMYSGYKKKRNSVFSRLSLAPDVYVQENGDDVANEELNGDTSVAEVMARLQQSCYQWEKTKKSKSLNKRRDDAENFRNKIQTTSCPKLERDCFDMNLKEMKMNSPLSVEENMYQTAERSLFVDFEHPSAEVTPFVDFKRRSAVRKIDDDTKTRGCCEIARSDKLLGVQLKRRKLIRPDFGKKESSNEQGLNDDVSQSIDVLSQEGSLSKDKPVRCEALNGSQDKETNLSQSFVICPISGDYKNTIVERGLNCEGESKAESCETSFRAGCKDEKESSQDTGIQNACEVKSHNAEDGLGIKDPIVGQLSLRCDDTSHSILQKSFVESEEENAYKGTVHDDIEHGRRVPQSVENFNELSRVSEENAMGNTVNSSSVEGATLQRIPEEFIDICVDEGKRNNQKSAFRSIAKQSEAAVENARCLNVEESSEEICEGNVGLGERLATPNGGKSCEMEFHQNIENSKEVLPAVVESFNGH